ncbi:hypothetical protein WA026_002228 [Henosepilachna vigintioctopunctata]|uniref:Poly(A) polymerase RNA-binding domain-containing protein n=1 Tax=Henosepilachna vigintioctopunctata TaxID=420089 RepID=A0AAW1TZM5_9CUCU
MFIGLEFQKTEPMNIDLTFDIQKFMRNVYHHGENIVKTGMMLDAQSVKRQQLIQYSAPSIFKRERKVSYPTTRDTRKDRWIKSCQMMRIRLGFQTSLLCQL